MVICYDKITYEALRMDFRGMPMPYFMAYPEYPGINGLDLTLSGEREAVFWDLSGQKNLTREKAEKDLAMQDFEYLRRTYPTMIGKYQRRVEEILDAMDYEGSMIYDEYPDRLSLLDLGNSVAKSLARVEMSGETVSPETKERQMSAMEEAYLQGLAQVLTCNEIFRRRQKRKQEGYTDKMR